MNPTDTLNLPPMPPRIAKLPRNARGYPVPFFVAWIDGKPDFRIVRPETVRLAMRNKLCWICGEPLNTQSTFAIGPMCCVNHVNSEPPSHRQCAEFAVKACPFILHPNMVRREDEKIRDLELTMAQPGVMIKRNPGVMCLWTVAEWAPFNDGKGMPLFNIGTRPKHVSWWREGRPATFEEIEISMLSGRPLLLETCETPAERKEVYNNTAWALRLAQRTCI